MRICKNVILVMWLLLLLGCATEINRIKLKEAPKPDDRVLNIVSSVMREYIQGLEWKERCVLEMDTRGFIETNWHPVLEGEEEMDRKIQIYIWGNVYRVDVWHRNLLTPFKGRKDYMSRLVEMKLQFAIEKKMSQVKSNAYLNPRFYGAGSDRYFSWLGNSRQVWRVD